MASDREEAKWNFTFWLQNEELVIGGQNYDPVSNWVKRLSCYYTDEQGFVTIGEFCEHTGIKESEVKHHMRY